MKKVRFLEGCYMFSTQKFYNSNTVVVIDEKQANSLYKKGLVDILDDEEFITQEDIEKEEVVVEQTDDLNSLTVPELQEIAKEKDVEYKGLRKAELINALEEGD